MDFDKRVSAFYLIQRDEYVPLYIPERSKRKNTGYIVSHVSAGYIVVSQDQHHCQPEGIKVIRGEWGLSGGTHGVDNLLIIYA